MNPQPVSKNLVEELINNSIALQKTTLQLVETTQQVTERTDRILSLFEEAAKNIEKAELKQPLAQQLEVLLEQNRTIAKGLVILEKYIREKSSFGIPTLQPSRPLPKI